MSSYKVNTLAGGFGIGFVEVCWEQQENKDGQMTNKQKCKISFKPIFFFCLNKWFMKLKQAFMLVNYHSCPVMLSFNFRRTLIDVTWCSETLTLSSFY